MSNPRRTNLDGSYTPLATMSKAEWDALKTAPDSLGPRWGKQQITVNSSTHVVIRGRQQKRTNSPKGA